MQAGRWHKLQGQAEARTMSLLSASPILFHSWRLSPGAHTNVSHSGRCFFHRIPHSTVSSLKALLKFRLLLPPDYSSSDPQEAWQDPGKWQTLSHPIVSTLPFWEVAKTTTRSTEIQKRTTTKKMGREDVEQKGRIQTTQKRLREAFWAIHTLGYPGPHLSLQLGILHRLSSWKGKKKSPSLPFSRDYTHLCRAASQQQHSPAHLPWRSFVLILATKETWFTNERTLYQAYSTSRRKFKVFMSNHCFKEKTPQTKMLHY